MITTLIICLTVIFCVVWITLWIKHMVTRNLPMFTYGACVWKDAKDSNTTPVNTPVGFAQPPEEESSEKKSDKELREALMQDPITMTAALLRGEVDIDDVTT